MGKLQSVQVREAAERMGISPLKSYHIHSGWMCV